MKYTQEQLEAMSDLDLSEVITVIQDINYNKRDSKIYQAIKHNGDNVVSIEGSVDYCNNPSDMMPLAFEAGLSLASYGVTYNANDGYLDSGGLIVDIYNAAEHKNPLRALATVYILIKQ